MKKNPLAAILVGLLFISSISSALMAAYYFSTVRSVRTMQGQMNAMNLQRSRIQALAQEAYEYSKRNPAIDPILREFGAKPKDEATAKPAGR